MLDEKVAAIASKASKFFPDIDFQASFAWTGSFGESPNSLPAIGQITGMPRCYSVLGFGGNGITFSMLAAQLVSRHIQGIDDPMPSCSHCNWRVTKLTRAVGGFKS